LRRPTRAGFIGSDGQTKGESMESKESAYARQYDSESDFSTEPMGDGSSVRISRYLGDKQAARIPPRIQGLPVTSIGDLAFAYCSSLTSVTFQGTIASNNFSFFAFSGDLHNKFYATDATNGTPGTYTTTAPVEYSSVWTKQ
jgi:hypothetical protein